MNLLLDTHTFLWQVEGSPSLSPDAINLITDPANPSYLSMASVWEMAIKVSLNKLALSRPFLPFVADALKLFGVYLLPISLDDCDAYRQLPFSDPKHRDPFDRMLVAQAHSRGLSLVSADAAFDAYGITRLW